MNNQKLVAVRYNDQGWILRQRIRTTFGWADHKLAVTPKQIKASKPKDCVHVLREQYKAKFVLHKTTEEDGWKEEYILIPAFPTRQLARDAGDYVTGLFLAHKMSVAT